jgi:large-conductance mechanosensitive channel
MLCYETFRSFMFSNKIAGASVAYAIGLASAEFAKSLTLKGVIPFLQRLLERFGLKSVFGAVTAYDFEDISTMALYWVCMIGVSFVISEYIFGRLLLGTATVLDKSEKVNMRKAEDAIDKTASPMAAAKDAVAAVVRSVQAVPSGHA